MKIIIDGEIVLSRPLEGPLAAHITAFAKWARAQGYARRSRYRQVLLAACFSRWLGRQAVSVCRVSSEQLARYLRSRMRHVQIHRGDAAALRQFLDFLRRQDVVPKEKIPPGRLTPIERVVQAFERYIRNERALSEAAVINYVPFVRKFLADRFGNGSVRLSHLRAGDVVRFTRRQAPRLHLKRAKLLTTALRSFLHYARYRGDITRDLAAAVPAVASWSMTSIPRAIPADAVRQLLASINRRSGDDETRTRDLCRDSARFFGNCLKLCSTDGYQDRALEPQVTSIGP
jgi:site-specific recombinase XerD